MRFRDYAEGDWSTLVLPTFKLSTRRGYRMVLGRHLLPRFGDVQLCDITKLGVQQLVGEKCRQGLPWQTVRNAWIVLPSILDSAVEYGYLAVNPARGIKFPPQSRRQDPEIFTAEAFARLLAHLEEPFKTMVTLAALTGLRIGEVLGHRWRALDFVAGTIRVSDPCSWVSSRSQKAKRATARFPSGLCWGGCSKTTASGRSLRVLTNLSFKTSGADPTESRTCWNEFSDRRGRRQESDA
jgi:integrase